MPRPAGTGFTREAGNAKTAVQSAMHHIRKAIPDAVLVEASPDLVAPTAIADSVSMNRQALRKRMLTHQRSCPLPVHAGSNKREDPKLKR